MKASSGTSLSERDKKILRMGLNHRNEIRSRNENERRISDPKSNLKENESMNREIIDKVIRGLIDNERTSFENLSDSEQWTLVDPISTFVMKSNVLMIDVDPDDHDENEIGCYLCGRTFEKESYFNTHVKRHFREIDELVNAKTIEEDEKFEERKKRLHNAQDNIALRKNLIALKTKEELVDLVIHYKNAMRACENEILNMSPDVRDFTRDEIINAFVQTMLKFEHDSDAHGKNSEKFKSKKKYANANKYSGYSVGFSNARFFIENLLCDLLNVEDIEDGVQRNYLHLDSAFFDLPSELDLITEMKKEK